MHGNFAEYVPIALILLYMIEESGILPVYVHILGMMLLTGRIIHLMALYSAAVSKKRVIGMVLTLSMILISATLLIFNFILVRTPGL